MTAEEALFIICEECNYNPIEEKTGKFKPGIQWRINIIKKNVPEDQIENFTKRLLLGEQTEFLKKGQIISLATFNKYLKPSEENLEYKAIKAFESIVKNLNRYRDFITDDKRAIVALESIGGWIELCNCNPEYLTLKQDKFVKTYIKCNPEIVEHRRFVGDGTTGKVVYLGSEENKHLIEIGSNQVDISKLLEDKIAK